MYSYGRAKAGRPARTYIQQLFEDAGCCPENLPGAMNDREELRERVRDIHDDDDDIKRNDNTKYLPIHDTFGIGLVSLFNGISTFVGY